MIKVMMAELHLAVSLSHCHGLSGHIDGTELLLKLAVIIS